MIDGLKMTLTGEELRKLLEARAAERRAAAARWQSQRERKAETATEDAPLLPDHMCENEADRQEWHAEVLTFLHDHLDPSEIYRLDLSDLEYRRAVAPEARVARTSRIRRVNSGGLQSRTNREAGLQQPGNHLRS